MNRFHDPRYTGVYEYRTCTSPCCAKTPRTVVTIRDEDGHLIEGVHAEHLNIVAGAPNMSRMEKWEAAGRPDLIIAA